MESNDFQKSITQGIPDELPKKKPFDETVSHAPKRKDILTTEEKRLALKNALRYFPEKIYEAWTALASNRVHLHDDYAEVSSSDGEKGYTIRFLGNQYSSDDNATYWRGYAGYPVIAVLMLQGKLPYDRQEAELWKDINWTVLNKKYRNNYAEAVEEISQQRNIDMRKAELEAQKVMEALKELPLEIKRKIK